MFLASCQDTGKHGVDRHDTFAGVFDGLAKPRVLRIIHMVHSDTGETAEPYQDYGSRLFASGC